MSEIITFPISEALPRRAAVLKLLGVPECAAPTREVEAVFAAAVQAFTQTVRPIGILLEISRPDFQAVYEGEGCNDPRTPITDILPCSDALALFAVTVGERICEEIRTLFTAHDFAKASMLDSMASAAADQLATRIAQHFLQSCLHNGSINASAAVLPYSPGYCGWHITGQRRLFQRLRPEHIGICLNDSCLMIPLKSVSGVAIVARQEMHGAVNSYPFCRECETRACQERMPGDLSMETINRIQR